MAKAASFDPCKTSRDIANKLQTVLTAAVNCVDDHTSEGALARGKIFSLAAYTEEAIDSFEQALHLDEGNHEAAARLTLMQLRLNKSEQSLSTAMNLASKAPNYTLEEMTSDEQISAFTILGNALVQNNRVEDAVQAYETARKEAGNDTTAAARLAQLYIATGKPAEALKQTDIFKDNPRYSKLSSFVALGARNPALMPTYDPASLSSQLALDAHGRPLTVNGEARLAEVAEDPEWCADVEVDIDFS